MRYLMAAIIAIVMAVWVVAIAILSIQNVFIPDAVGNDTLVTLKFLGQTSIPLPFGLTLALSAALGMITTAIGLPLVLPIFGAATPQTTRRRSGPRR